MQLIFFIDWNFSIQTNQQILAHYKSKEFVSFIINLSMVKLPLLFISLIALSTPFFFRLKPVPYDYQIPQEQIFSNETTTTTLTLTPEQQSLIICSKLTEMVTFNLQNFDQPEECIGMPILFHLYSEFTKWAMRNKYKVVNDIYYQAYSFRLKYEFSRIFYYDDLEKMLYGRQFKCDAPEKFFDPHRHCAGCQENLP